MAETKAKVAAVAGDTGNDALRKAFAKIVKDRIAFAAFLILAVLYALIIFADVIAPYSEQWSDRSLAHAPPTPVYTVDENGISRPYIFRYEREFDSGTFQYAFVPDRSEKYYVRFFVPGSEYRILGIIPGNIHLFGVDEPARINLLGTDMNGRDLFSRLFFGGQISLTIGFLSLFIAFPVGMIFGGLSGYFGGWLDNLMMRTTEVIMSIPSLYLLITLAAIIPSSLPSSARFAMVVIALSFVGWAGFSRVIRGMVLAIKEQEFVEASRAIGLDNFRIIVRHILPQTASFVIVALTLAIPSYILMESGLSFLGLGIQQPDASWGNMLREAQNITNVIYHPWMLTPALFIFLAVLSFNVIGDAIRDVLDPKSYIRR